MAIIVCRHCKKRFSDKSPECPFCKTNISDASTISSQEEVINKTDSESLLINEPALDTNKNNIKKKTKHYISPIIVISIIVALIISFIALKLYVNIEKEKANQEYSILVKGISSQLINLAILSEDVIDRVDMMWRYSLSKEDYEYDAIGLDDAIYTALNSKKKEIEEIKTISNNLYKSMKTMNPPDGKEKDVQRLKELYLLFIKYSDMAISPSGSLQSYSQQNHDLTIEIKSAIKELELMQ